MAGTAPISLAGLPRSSGYFTFGGATFYSREDWSAKHAATWENVYAHPYGLVDRYKKDVPMEHDLVLYGSIANLSVLFPSYALNPVNGASIFPSSDANITPFVWCGKNGDRLTYHNSRIVGLASLYLGMDSELFEAAVRIRTLIRPGYKPKDAGAYFTRDTFSYAEPGFVKSTLYKARWTGAWGNVAGFATLVSKKGFSASWKLGLNEQRWDGYGVTDMTVSKDLLIGEVKAQVAGPTSAQFDSASGMLVDGATSDIGTLQSAFAHDLTITSEDATHSVVMYNASLIEYNTVSSDENERVGECTWQTTRGFSGSPSAPTAVSAVS